MVDNVEDTEQRGGETADFRIFLISRHRVLGGYPPHGPRPEGVPGPGGKATHRESPMAGSEQNVG